MKECMACPPGRTRGKLRERELRYVMEESGGREKGAEVRCGQRACPVSLACSISEPTATHCTVHSAPDLQLSNHPDSTKPSQANSLSFSLPS